MVKRKTTSKTPVRKSKIQSSVSKAKVTKKKKDKMNTSTKVLIILGVFAFIFIVTMVITFWVKDSVPDTLIQYVLGAGGVEALLLAGIKISKVLTESNREIALKKYGTNKPTSIAIPEDEQDDEEVVER